MKMPTRPPTDFERKVYDTVSRVPQGCVTTYKILADAIGCRSSRAIGQALRRNPFAPEVPCHRVIQSDLRLGGYSGRKSGAVWDRKRRRLEAEGVQFDQNGRLKGEDQIFRF